MRAVRSDLGLLPRDPGPGCAFLAFLILVGTVFVLAGWWL